MGSSYSWRLTIENRNPSLEQSIFDAANSMKAFSGPRDPKIQNWMWFLWSPEVKWWAVDFVQELSKQFRETVFRLECHGDANFNAFFLNGEFLDERQIWQNPPFPSRPLLKKKLAEAKIAAENARKLREEQSAKAEKELMQKELETLKAKQRELENKLAV